MRVAHVMDHFLPANLGLIYDTIIESRMHGVDPTVLSMKRKNENLFPFDNVFSLHSLNPISKNWIRFTGSLNKKSFGLAYYERIIPKARPRLLHSHFIWMGETSCKLKQEFDLPLVLTLYGEDDIKVELSQPAKERFREIFRKCDSIVAVSKYVEERARAIGIGNSEIRVIYPGVDTARFSPSYTGREQDLFVIGIAARLDRVKGLDNLLLAFKGFQKRWPRSKLKIAGSGGLQKSLVRMTNDLGIKEKVEFCGWVPRPEMPSFYRGIDLFVLPSTVLRSGVTEAAGVVLLEAQACGVPIVASNTGGISEIVLDKHSAILVPPNDSSLLETAMDTLAQDKQVRIAMGNCGRENVVRNFALKTQTGTLVKLYLGTLKR